jgi:hypothetical protein
MVLDKACQGDGRLSVIGDDAKYGVRSVAQHIRNGNAAFQRLRNS